MLDIDQIRADTPGLAHTNHLLASGAGLMPQPVIDAIIGHTELEARIGGYEAHAARADALDATYDSIAALIGARREEIALVENATVGWCQAFYALPLKSGDRIITCEAEYAANYVAYLQRQKRDGILIDVVPSDETGAADVEALKDLITDRTALIAMTWVPTNGGLVNPAAEIGAIARKAGIPFLLDACQAVGQMEVDVEALNCDFLSATARKFLRGPRGIGFLYIRKAWLEKLEPAMIDHFAAPWVSRDTYRLRDDARRFETWENNYALRAGLKAASDYAQSIGMKAIEARARMLAAYLRDTLRTIPGVAIRDLGPSPCAIVSFTIDGLEPTETVAQLRQQKIAIGATDRQSTRIDAERRHLHDMLRAAPHYYNNERDLDQLVSALKALL